MSLLNLLFVFQFYVTTHLSYYFSLTEIPWQNASNYCHKFCNSELVSIHSDEEYQNILDLIQQNINYIWNPVWIGLYRNPIAIEQFLWIDDTPFDFGNNTIQGTYPWSDNSPHTPAADNCIELRNTQNFKWYDSSCSNTRHFICDNCDGVLTKYIGRSDNVGNFSVGTDDCLSFFNTTLASIHSEDDFFEAQLISIERNQDYYIGLKDKYKNFNFSWLDGTTFDYGSNTTQGAYPWSPGNPNPVSNQHCVIIDDGNNFLWNDRPCDRNDRHMCNKPSEICHSDEWVLFDPLNTNIQWNLCEVSLEDLKYDKLRKSIVVLNNKQWITNDINKAILVEYMFTMFNSSVSEFGPSTGLVIYYNEKCTDYVEVGIYYGNNTMRLIVSDGTFIIQDLNSNLLQFDVFYRLKISVSNGTVYNVFLNDHLYINTILNVNIMDKRLSGSIGIFSNDGVVNAKYLFVSGEAVYGDNTNWFDLCAITDNPTSVPTNNPSSNPTTNPTTHPSTNPTVNPTYYTTIDPTYNPTYYPTINPTTNPTNNPTIYYPSSNPTDSPVYILTIDPSINSTHNTIEQTHNTTSNPIISTEYSNTTNVAIGTSITQTSMTATNANSEKKNNSESTKFIITIVIISVCSILLIFVICMACFVYAFKKKSVLRRRTTMGMYVDDNKQLYARKKDNGSIELEQAVQPDDIKNEIHPKSTAGDNDMDIINVADDEFIVDGSDSDHF